MTKGALHRRLYGALLHLYPRAFRREWRDELLQAFDDLRAHPPRATRHPVARAWATTARDLVTSVPRQRLEQAMPRFSPLGKRLSVTLPTVGVIWAAAAAASLGVLLLLPVVAVVAATIAVRRRHTLRDVLVTGLRWYELALLAVAVFAAIAVGSALVPDVEGFLADFLWWLAFSAFLMGWALLLVAGAAAARGMWRRLRPRPAAA